MRFPRPGPHLFGPIFLAFAALTACGGGSSSVPPPATTPSPAAPAAIPTIAPATAASTVPLASGAIAAQSLSIPPAGGLSGSLLLPAATLPAGDTLTLTTTTTMPAGVPALSVGRRVSSVSSGLEVLYYQGIGFSETTTFPAYPALTVVLPAGYDTSLGVFELAFYDGTSWTYPLGAAGVPNGQTLSFSAAPGPVTYLGQKTYYVALYYAPTAPTPTPVPTASPTSVPTTAPSATPSPAPSGSPTVTPVPTATPAPTATPTATPTPSPTPTPGPLSATPSLLSFVGTGAALAQTVTVSSPFYTGSYTASTCVGGTTTIATVSAVAANGTLSVTPQAAGSCTITITDAASRTTQVVVNVATSSLTVNARKH